jgi:hypothetical protein
MNIQESLDPRGRLTIRKTDRHCRSLGTVEVNNSIVASGRDLIAKLFVDQPIASVSHVAVGIGSAEVKTSDEKLSEEIFRKELAKIDPSLHIVKTQDDRCKVTISAELDFDEANKALTEAGLFNDAEGGVMYNRVVFPPINKTTDFKLTLIWEIVF